METKEVLYELRMKHKLTQDELAEKLFVTRQAVSRWEKGETVPNSDTLKLLSKYYNVSSTRFSARPIRLYASAAVCLWRTASSAATATGL